jgi:hypothetical protein
MRSVTSKKVELWLLAQQQFNDERARLWRIFVSIFETVGLAWVIFSSTIASIAILFLAYIGLKSLLLRADQDGSFKLPVEVKNLLKLAR